MEGSAFRTFVTYTIAGAIAMGCMGFICGYVGPLVLSEEPGIAPIIGILMTGPLGALAGALTGAVAALAGLRLARFAIVAAAGTSIVAGASLYTALPEDRWVGVILDASIRGCSTPDTLVPGAVAKWDKWSDRSTSLVPKSAWKEGVAGMLERDKGVLLTMFVYRKRDVFKQQTPWNKDVLRAGPWEEDARMEVFFDRRTMGDCSLYPLGAADFYTTEWEMSNGSPPEVLSSFLGLEMLKEVPASFQEFVRGQKPAS